MNYKCTNDPKISALMNSKRIMQIFSDFLLFMGILTIFIIIIFYYVCFFVIILAKFLLFKHILLFFLLFFKKIAFLCFYF